MILSLHPCFVADHQIIQGSRDLSSDELSLINNARVIILPQSCSEELYRLCSESGALLFPSYETRFEYQGKTGQSILFKKAGLPHPETMQWDSVLGEVESVNIGLARFVSVYIITNTKQEK